MLSAEVLPELERVGIKFEFLPNDWVRVLCPFHDDTTPSCDINTSTKMFKCHSCRKTGDLVTFIARVSKTERWSVIADFAARYGDVNDRIVDPQLIETWHQRIWQAEPLLIQLRKRGVTDEMIRRYRLGETGGRIQIPVKNSSGLYVNVVGYSPGAPTQKFIHMRGRGRIPRLYPYEQLKYEKIMLCGGFMKAIVAAAQLNPVGIGAVTAASGETNWDPSLNMAFKDKEVIVCLDIDEAGQTAAEERCKNLLPFALKIFRLDLPLDWRDFPKGDINDFVATGGDLVPLVQSLSEWRPAQIAARKDEPIMELDINDAFSARYSGRRVKVKAMVAAVGNQPYHLPSEIRARCDRKQESCGTCPVFSMERDPLIEIPPESPVLLAMMDENVDHQARRLKEALLIPECPSVKFEVEKYGDVEDSQLCPDLSISSETPDSVYVAAAGINTRFELNETYYLTGRFVPHPRTQSAHFVVSQAEPAVDALTSFKLEAPEMLECFQPRDWSLEQLEAKLEDIYTDLENEVTQIFQRRQLHLAIDLAYHSCMLIPYGDIPVKGWVETLIVSDTSQGKSTAVERMRNHYGLGETVTCKNATTAGLIGGAAQFDGSRKWFIKWGVFPTHDRRLVILEELKGMHHEVFSKLTDMRSSGIADIPKIERRRAHARTRLIALTNTRRGKDVAAYGYGIDCIRELIPNLEDIRRFDLALVLSKEEVDVRELHQRERVKVRNPRYTSEACRQLVLWAWTRSPGQVKVAKEVAEVLTQETLKLCDKYSDDMPLLDRGSARQKLARLATALACRTFSTDEDYENVHVRESHVKYVSNFIDACYSTKAHGYHEFSKRRLAKTDVIDPNKVMRAILASPFPRQLATRLLEATEIDRQDVCDWCGWDSQLAQTFMSVLTRNSCIERDGKMYKKTASFVRLLQEKLNNGAFKVPDHVEDEINDGDKF